MFVSRSSFSFYVYVSDCNHRQDKVAFTDDNAKFHVYENNAVVATIKAIYNEKREFVDMLEEDNEVGKVFFACFCIVDDFEIACVASSSLIHLLSHPLHCFCIDL